MSFSETIHEPGILELIFSRPPVNAYRIGDLLDLAKRLERIRDEPEIRAVILRSDGRGFCAGGDLSEMRQLSGFQGILGQADGSLRASVAIAECAVPVIAAVHRYCIGVGVLLAGVADILITDDDANFTLAEIDVGATAGAIQAIGLMPEKRLRWAMLTGDPIPARELAAYGSVHRLVPTVDLASAALDAATKIASKSIASIRAMKASINSATARGLREKYRSEFSYTFELNMLGESSKARNSFLDK